MRVPGGLFLWGYGVLLALSGFLFVYGDVHSEDDEWIDPYDMLNYDSGSKSMRKPAEVEKTELLHVKQTTGVNFLLLKCYILFSRPPVTVMYRLKEENTIKIPVKWLSVQI